MGPSITEGQPGRESQSLCPQSSAGHAQVFLKEMVPAFRECLNKLIDPSIPHSRWMTD